MTKLALQLGLTLIELMVALVLGLIMSAVVASSYFATKQTYLVTEAVSRMQENARFAMHFIRKEARNAGNLGCINRVRSKLADVNYYNLEKPIFGYEFSGTEYNNSAFNINETPKLANAGDWGKTLPSFLADDQIVSGSDIVAFKSIEKMTAVPALSAYNSDTQLNTSASHKIADGSILLVGDCVQAELFKLSGGDSDTLDAEVGSAPVNIDPSLIAVKWGRDYGPESSIYQVWETYFYVGRNVSGEPALFRVRHNMAAGLNPRREELVEGVESIQVLYGEDTSVPVDRQPNIYRSADDIANWQNVVSIRVGALLRSPNNVNEVKQETVYTLLDAIKFKTSTTDNILRYAVSSSIKNRNRGLEGGYVVCQADALGCNTLQ